jgi:3-isopropylmalate/(R)-2-methylmalate dehydratase small subunit
MEPFRSHTGLVAPLLNRDVDTDQIIPKQFLKRLGRTGFEDGLFHDWRMTPEGQPRPDFVLNKPRYQGATILVAGANFGCGSSREHAVWALRDGGFRVVLAPSFADIFASNALANGFLAGQIDQSTLDGLAARIEATPGYRMTVDLEGRRLRGDGGFDASFAIDDQARARLLDGLDDIALILRHEGAIERFETTR